MGGLWRLRLAEACAELALARGDCDVAISLVRAVIEQSRATGRIKYEVLGLLTQSRALVRLGRTSEAVSTLGLALPLTRSISDPALFRWAAETALSVDGSPGLSEEARANALHISLELPDLAPRLPVGLSPEWS
jgi:hypothetical protein